MLQVPSVSGKQDFSVSSSHTTASEGGNLVGENTTSVNAETAETSTTQESPCEQTPSAPPPPPLQASPPPPTRSFIDAVLNTLRSTLPSSWIPVADWSGLHIIQLYARSPKAIQKEMFMGFDALEEIFVHLSPINLSSVILEAVSPCCTKLDEGTIQESCTRGLNIMKKLLQFTVCCEANDEQTKHLWSGMSDAYVDNLFKGNNFQTTCRSTSCDRLVPVGGKQKRRGRGSKLLNNLRRKKLHLTPEDGSSVSAGPFRYMTNEERFLKLYQLRDEINKKDKQIAYLKKKLQKLSEDEGVDVDSNLSDDLTDILSRSDLSPMQKIFFEEQVKQSQHANSKSHRWHPTMIRLALHLQLKSRSAYEALRDSGAVKLPTSRTLFNYSHAFDSTPGVNVSMVQIVAVHVATLKLHQHVNVIADEMHVSRNLVHRQSDGKLIGYVHHMEDLEKEIARFEECLRDDPPSVKLHLGNSILAFMAQGKTSNVKHVVAAYPCNQSTKDMLYTRTWHVISRLERAGVKVLSCTSDGCSVNRAFIAMHEPITTTESGVIFDTFNFCSKDERALYFVADVAHVLRTTRNCFYNSVTGEKKTRCLQINGQNIVWSTIVTFYLKYKQCTLRKTFRLNSQNVFPNSYSCMKVRLAAEVMSDTVNLHIEEQNWPNTSETVRFIRMVNKFFDCLNGAHESQHVKTRNANLKPHSDEADERFDWLENVFLRYIVDWRKQATEDCEKLKQQRKGEKMKKQGEQSKLSRGQIRDEDPKRRMLSLQTQQGIEMAIKSFSGATRYLIQVAKMSNDPIFINARAFSQDHLDNYLSRQRAAGGGSSNPNVFRLLGNLVSIGLQRELGLAQKKGSNAPETAEADLDSEPLPKRARPSK